MVAPCVPLVGCPHFLFVAFLTPCAGYAQDKQNSGAADALSQEDAARLAEALSAADEAWEVQQLSDMARNPAARKLTQATVITCGAITKLNALASNLQSVGNVITQFRCGVGHIHRCGPLGVSLVI